MDYMVCMRSGDLFGFIPCREHDQQKQDCVDMLDVELQLADNACGKPVVISGSMDAWPAMSKWKDLQYLRDQCGARTVPIEVQQHATQMCILIPMRYEWMLM